MTPKYHDKKYEHKTLFCHTRQQEVKMIKLVAHLQLTNKSELCRVLIDEAYKTKCL